MRDGTAGLAEPGVQTEAGVWLMEATVCPLVAGHLDHLASGVGSPHLQYSLCDCDK